MPKSYSQFTFEDLKAIGISINDGDIFPNNILPIEPTPALTNTLEKNSKRKLDSEKAKSELLITPILTELEDLNPQKFAFYSGYQFNVDKSLGLMGYCDFVLSKEARSHFIEAPAFCIVEAKNENLKEGITQCIAEMYAAQLFNQKNKKEIANIYGAVTFGFQWKFIQLSEKQTIIDTDIYYINELPRLLGVLNYIVNQ